MQGRKLYPTPTNDQNISCPNPYDCGGGDDIYSIPPSSSPWLLPEPVSSNSTSSNGNRPVSTLLIIVITVLATTFLLVSYYVILMKYCKRWNPFRQRRPPTTMNVVEFFDENRGPQIDHPIWYINTIGLQPSVISAIAVFRYKTEDNLIEGTDCAVCLNEFQDGETLRLLPKCNHAFHIPCIDTWLRSHTNCPVCRAGIVSAPFTNPVVYSNRVNTNSVVLVPAVESSAGGNSETTGDSNGSSSSSSSSDIITAGHGENRSSDTNADDVTEIAGTVDKANVELKLGIGNSDDAIEDEKHEIQSASLMRRYVSVDSFMAAEISGSVEQDAGGNSGIQRTSNGDGSSIRQSFRERNLSR